MCAEGNGAAIAAGLDAVGAARARARFTGTERRRDAPLIHPNQGLFDRKFYVRSYSPANSPDYDFLVGGSIAGSAPDPVRTPFLSVLENAPRFWLTPEVSYADAHDRRALTALRGTGFPHAVPIFVHSRIPGATDRPEAPVVPGSYGAVQVMQYLPERVVLRVEAPEDAWLFCAERYAPGWKAAVDGTPTKVFKADFCFRALQVAKGVHQGTVAVRSVAVQASLGIVLVSHIPRTRRVCDHPCARNGKQALLSDHSTGLRRVK